MKLTPAITLVAFAFAAQVRAEEPEKTTTPPANYGQIQKASYEKLRDGFSQPDMIYAPFAFWFWDEPLDAGKYPAKARDMARKMMEQRMNPGYAHPRRSAADIFPKLMKPSPNLPKEQWLSKEWFDSFDAALTSAEASKGYLGSVDEHMWPIGRAAGRVLKQHPELEKTWLQWKTSEVAVGKTMSLPASFFTVAAKLADDSPAVKASRSVGGPLTDVPSAMQGEWIWKTDPADTARQFYLRRTFDLKAGLPIRQALLRIAVDNTYKVFINGTVVGEGSDWKKVGSYNVAPMLRIGRNVIAVEGGGDGGMDAMLCHLEIELDDGQPVNILSDTDWVISKTADAGWNQPDFKDSEWSKVRVLGPANMGPWNLSETKNAYQIATVQSATLQRIGSGAAFTWTAPSEGNWRVYTFTKVPGADVNVLDKRLAKAFIEIAHQPYADRFGARMGKAIPGVFCDTEGSYGNNGNGIPWSDDLGTHYQKLTGRDAQLWMPMMFDDDAEGISARARVDWFNAMSDLYSGFHGEVSDWLEQRGMYYIANLWEESLQWQTTMVGDYMKNMRGFSLPGTDCLTLKAYDVHDFKETQAVAEFEGRRLQSEIMGAGGWRTLSPVTMKECTNSVLAWGVSHVVPHGIFMTRNLDDNPWVPDWYDVNPFWSNLHLWTDFTRRASFVNSHGHAMADVLLLQPGESAWALLGQTDKLWSGRIHNLGELDGLYAPEVQTSNKVYGEAMRQMTRHRVEYLVADAHYISQMKREGSELVRGDFRFKTIVMPPMAVMQMAQAKAVVDFAKAGGRVYILGKLPTGSTDNGLYDPAMAASMKELQAQPTAKACPQGLDGELKSNAPGLESHLQFISGEFPMLQHHRRIDGRDFFWLVNNSKDVRQSVVQVTGTSGEASVWDCETGKVLPVVSTKHGVHSKLALAFQPHEAYWLVFDPKRPPLAEPLMNGSSVKTLLQFPSADWKVRVEPTAQPNLQHAVEIPPALTAAEGVERDLSLWETWSDLPKNFSGLVDYTKTITLPSFKGDLVLELGLVHHIAEVWVNGKPLGAKLWPPHRFPSSAFRQGKNEVRIRVGNLVNNNYKMASPSGLLGPVTVQEESK